MNKDTQPVSPNGDEPIRAAEAAGSPPVVPAPSADAETTPEVAPKAKSRAKPKTPRAPRRKKAAEPAPEEAVAQVVEATAPEPPVEVPAADLPEPPIASPAPVSAEIVLVDALIEEAVEGAGSEAAAGADRFALPEALAGRDSADQRPPAEHRAQELNPLLAALLDHRPAHPVPEPSLAPPEAREVDTLRAGEPIPLFGRGEGSTPPAARAELIFVPEAHEETPLFMDGRGRRDRRGGIPPITPDLLAEVRGEAGPGGTADASAEPVPYRLRGKAQTPAVPRPDKGQRSVVVHPAAPAGPPAEPEPALVLAQDALLDVPAAEWAAEEWETAEVQAEAGALTGGRRRRRRGRERDRERPEQRGTQPAPAMEAAPAPAPAGPLILGKPDEEPYRHERERRGRDREREREREPREGEREQREYKEILINVSERETRIAVLESGRLVELHVEREERVVGGIYKARVSNVLPGMDAAFVDIGLERNAFLYVGDILFDDPRSGGSGDSPQRRTSRDVRIKDLVKPGQELLVQVVKGPRGTKGARVSTKISLPGRYLVLMPDGDHLGVSRKIDDARERDRLKKIADQLQPKGFGLIVRTEAEGRSETELRQDLDYLYSTWQKIAEKNTRVKAPALIQADLGIVMKTIRDLFGQDVDKLVIDVPEEFEKVEGALTQLAPDLVDRVQLYDEREPLFIRYNVEDEIDRLLRRKVWLRNGAYLLIDTTEALTTIDVNTGKFVGTSSLAETILKTNLDAVDEIARQLRLRDIGGMIVLDFIDMASSRDRQQVMRALENAFKKDRTRIKIAHISPLGLVEMTRKRTAENVTDVMSHVCPYCQGRGRVWSPETIAIRIEREVMRLCATQEVEALMIHANPEVVANLIGPEGESIEQLERMLRRPLYIRAHAEYHVEQYEVVPGDIQEMDRSMLPFRNGQIVEAQVAKMELIQSPRSAAWVDGYFVDLANGSKFQGQRIRIRLTDVRRSFSLAEPAPGAPIDRGGSI